MSMWGEPERCQSSISRSPKKTMTTEALPSSSWDSSLSFGTKGWGACRSRGSDILKGTHFLRPFSLSYCCSVTKGCWISLFSTYFRTTWGTDCLLQLSLPWAQTSNLLPDVYLNFIYFLKGHLVVINKYFKKSLMSH